MIKIKDSIQTSLCALCGSKAVSQTYSQENRSFCCAGCHAVYQILATQGALERFQEHPVFQQALKAGLIANPELATQFKNLDLAEGEYQKLHLEIQEMWCPSCAKVISLILLQEKGIQQCVIDYTTDLAVIQYAPRFLSKERIMQLIRQLGYQPAPLQDSHQSAISRSLSLRFIIAAFFSLNIMMLAYPIYASYFHEETAGYTMFFAWLSLLGSIPILTYSAWPIWRRFLTGLRVGVWGMEALVLLGITAATGLSMYEMWRGTAYVYFDSLSVIITFVLLGKIIESKAKFSAKEALIQLTRALPRKGRKQETDGSEHFVPLKDIQPDDRIVVLTGEKIVLDGVVEDGEGSCDESIMTGEALPVLKCLHSSVLAGTLLQQGRLVIRVTAHQKDTALQRIIDIVSQDIEHKSPYVRAVDPIVKWFVPVVIVLAVITAAICWGMGVQDDGYTIMQTAIVRAISILLISCPCAIGIAAPLAEAHVLNQLIKLGVIVRNRGCLAFLGRETAFVFDKTGTITEGKLTVLAGLRDLSFVQQTCLKGLTAHSTHPIAVTIHQSLLIPSAKLTQVEEVIGRGLKGTYEGAAYYLGSADFLHSHHIDVELDENEDGATEGIETKVFFGCDSACLVCIRLGDHVKEDAKLTLESLKTDQTWLLSGDGIKPVQQVARLCGFQKWQAKCSPLDKRAFVEHLRQQGKIVMMMGDGINDAPALTAAHVGVAVISASDLSIQISDLLLTTPRLEIIQALRLVAQKGHRIMKQNLFWAFFYNILGIPLAMIGWLSPIFAATAMVLSSLIVLLNAQRIR